LIPLIVLVYLACREPAVKPGFRIVSLSPGMTEVIFALGAQNDLVGVTTYCDYPDAARKLPRVGDFSHPSLERILALNPDLVIVNRPEQSRIQAELEAFKLAVFTTEPESLADIYRDISKLGRAIGRARAADSLVAAMRQQIRPRGRKPRSVYIELSPRPLITIGRNTFLNEMVEMAGGRNIFDDLARSYPVISQEEVIKRDPEIIIVLHPEGIKDRIGWSRIRAVRENRIYPDLNQDQLLRPGPRLVLGFQALEKIFE
jgi:iron complex transport system substrate-binding protein